MSDIKLKIRHVKRGGDTKLDISGMALTEVPEDVFSLTQLESLDISGNRITSLEKIGSLLNLKNLYAQNNKIASLPKGLLELENLENLRLDGNSVAVMNTDLSVIFGASKIKKALESYFESQGDSSGSSSPTKPGFLSSTGNLNDAAYLRKKISELQMEITELKTGGGSSAPKSLEEQKNWMAPHSAGRPATASSQLKKVKELEDELKIERSNNKKLLSEVAMLKSEMSKTKILSSAAGEEGTIGAIPGVMEIPYDELEMDDQIGQGGFSIIKKGRWRCTDVAIKIIVDPVITDDLIAEVRNEVQMLSILKHPRIVILMGISSKTTNLAIVFEYMDNGCLFDLLHTSSTAISMEQRLNIAYEVAGIFAYLHKSEVVHRDLKSYNILVDKNFNIKLCDFGLCKFKADLNRGTMQFSGTPSYMAPELFQKKSYDEKVDVFAFGTLLWELIAREVPYDGMEPADIKEKVMAEEQLKLPFGTNSVIEQYTSQSHIQFSTKECSRKLTSLIND